MCSDILWCAARKCCITILHHAIENTLVNTITAVHDGKVSDGRPKPNSVYVVKQTESCLGPCICGIHIEIRYFGIIFQQCGGFSYYSLHVDVDNENPLWSNGTNHVSSFYMYFSCKNFGDVKISNCYIFGHF